MSSSCVTATTRASSGDIFSGSRSSSESGEPGGSAGAAASRLHTWEGWRNGPHVGDTNRFQKSVIRAGTGENIAARSSEMETHLDELEPLNEGELRERGHPLGDELPDAPNRTRPDAEGRGPERAEEDRAEAVPCDEADVDPLDVGAEGAEGAGGQLGELRLRDAEMGAQPEAHGTGCCLCGEREEERRVIGARATRLVYDDYLGDSVHQGAHAVFPHCVLHTDRVLDIRKQK